MDSLPSPHYEASEPKLLKIDGVLFENVHDNLPNQYYHRDNQDKNHHELPSVELIQQIVAQFGDFQTITEAKMDEIITGDSDSKDKMDVDDEHEDELRTYIENCVAKRDQMLHHVHLAYNSASVASDFISLLVSRVRPNAAQSSMSPLLKQHVKMGSLSYSVIPRNEDDEDRLEEERNKEIQHAKKIGRGWKLESLKKNSEKLHSAADQMKLKIQNEQTYWNDMIEIAQSNEVISTTSNREICVKYGFGDSGSIYYDKGVGILKKGDDGHVEFEKLENKERDAVWGGEKVCVIKIFKKVDDEMKLIGQSDTLGFIKKQLPLLLETDKLAQLKGVKSVLHEIESSRFYLFENELYWHLVKEAAGLVALNVELIDDHNKDTLELKSTIRFNLPSSETDNTVTYNNEFVVEISTVDVAEMKNLVHLDLPENNRADNLILLLRLLLCASHNRNLEKRTIPPVALSSQAKPFLDAREKYGFLIRPIIMYSKHNVAIRSIKKMFDKLVEDLGYKDKSEIIIKTFVDCPSNTGSFERICDNVSPKSSVQLTLKVKEDQELNVILEIKSIYRTLDVNFDVNVIDGKVKSSLFTSEFSNQLEMEECLSWVIKPYL